MRGYEGVHYQGPAAGLASNPPFVVHDECNNSEYESDRPRQSEESVEGRGPAVDRPTNDVVSPLTPEAHSVAWPQEAALAASKGEKLTTIASMP